MVESEQKKGDYGISIGGGQGCTWDKRPNPSLAREINIVKMAITNIAAIEGKLGKGANVKEVIDSEIKDSGSARMGPPVGKRFTA